MRGPSMEKSGLEAIAYLRATRPGPDLPECSL